MTAASILMRLANLDVHLEVSNQQICYDGPADALTDDLLNEMKKYKGELVGLIEDPLGLEETWPLSCAARSGQYRRTRSRILDETIVLAADNADLPNFGDTVVYRAKELRCLVGMSSERIRNFHEVKRYFDGIIEAAERSCR